MKYRKLGNRDIKVSAIGFGTWGIGGEVEGLKCYGPQNDKESIKALKKSFDLGVTFYDTANSYGLGHSEELLATAFENIRDKIIIATKGGYLNKFSKNAKNQCFDYLYINNSIQESLKRLKTDYIDIFQIHDAPISAIKNNEELFKLLTNYQKKGIIRYIGFAGRSPEDSLKALDIFNFDSIQINFNLTDMRALDSGLFNKCAKIGVGIIARTPLAFGFLAGKKNERSFYHKSDHRLRFAPDLIKKWRCGVELYENFFADELSTPAQRAIRFCLSFQEISTVNVGMLNESQVLENIGAEKLSTLKADPLKKIRELYLKEYKNIQIIKINEK